MHKTLPLPPGVAFLGHQAASVHKPSARHLALVGHQAEDQIVLGFDPDRVALKRKGNSTMKRQLGSQRIHVLRFSDIKNSLLLLVQRVAITLWLTLCFVLFCTCNNPTLSLPMQKMTNILSRDAHQNVPKVRRHTLLISPFWRNALLSRTFIWAKRPS